MVKKTPRRPWASHTQGQVGVVGNPHQSLRTPPRRACPSIWQSGLMCLSYGEEVEAQRDPRKVGSLSLAVPGAGRAARAQSKGCFQDEIVPVTTTVYDDKGMERRVTVAQDEGIRPSTTMEGLAKLKPAFKDGGSTTAGNSSQVSDGAAAILLARRSKAEELGLPILGILRSYAVVGVPPDIMGIGPVYAIPVALQKAGLTVNDVDIFEINEAFASQVSLFPNTAWAPSSPAGARGARDREGSCS
ncbi:acetyl-CoA acyltransferase 1 [Phyllostomus discolor]|uniref:acetyl-CoA C-acetyltransferase n=1 Tax=Phyllostomus discolor TaxID=89673 RepID=A0A833ZWD3_9CHIR|nr:acetyl-CoA acyltransferase 1 [Phyllostomus discolor]